MRRESDFDKLLRRFVVDSFKIIFSKDVRGIGNKIALLSVLANENKAGFLGTLIFLAAIVLGAAFIVHEEFF